MAKALQPPQAVQRWLAAVKAANAAKLVIAEEQALRKSVIATYFPRPREGVNIADAKVGALSLDMPYKRDLDAVKINEKWDELVAAGVPMDELVSYTPKLNTTLYRTLPPKLRKLIDKYMSVTLGSPSLTYVPDKQQ